MYITGDTMKFKIIYLFLVMAIILNLFSFFFNTVSCDRNIVDQSEVCYCVSECLQDYSEYSVVNYFTQLSHVSINYESRDCNTVDDKIRDVCCLKRID